jgi:hypothetical protein
MRSTLNLWRITCADLIVRTAYQVGKTPLMPLVAASLGASEFLVGAIVSVIDDDRHGFEANFWLAF